MLGHWWTARRPKILVDPLREVGRAQPSREKFAHIPVFRTDQLHRRFATASIQANFGGKPTKICRKSYTNSHMFAGCELLYI